MKKYIKYFFEAFPITYFGVSLAYAITGLIAGGDHVLTYAHIFYPMALAAACTFPTMLVCDTEKLSAKQLLWRRVIQLVLIEGIVLSTVYFAAPENSPVSLGELILVGCFVIIIYVLVRYVLWFTAYLEAEDLNRKLKALKENSDDSL
jgi:hypothetical protein